MLGILLLLFTYVSFVNVLLYSEYLLRLPHFAFTQSALAYLIPPIYYFYLRSLYHKRISLKPIHSLHLLPFLFFFILTMPFFLNTANEKIEILANIYNGNVSLRDTPFSKNLFYFGIIAQLSIYSFGIIKMHQKTKSSFKNTTPIIIKAFVIFWVIIFVLTSTRILLFYDLKSSILLPIFLAFGMYGLAYWSLSKQDYFHNFFEITYKYKKATISPEKMKLLSKELMKVLEYDLLYLDPELTATKIADKISISTHVLSQVINEELNDTFYNLINRFRVKEAKKKLRNPSYSNLSIEGIGKESGFKSKSSFYRAFKKFAGQTPLEFQNSK